MASHPISIGFAAWARSNEGHAEETHGSSHTSTSVSPPGTGFMSGAAFKSHESATGERDSIVTKEYYEALEKFLEAKRIVLAAGLPQVLAANGFWGASDEDFAIAQKAAAEGPEQALVIVTPEEAQARLQQAREALVASIPECKTQQTEGVSRLLASAFQRPVVLYHIIVTVNGKPVVELWKRYSQLEEVHEYLLTHPAKPHNLPEFAPKTWPRTIFSDKSDEDKEERREQLEHWLKIVISSPLVLQSRFLYEKLEISETESNNLMQYGQYLRALEKQLVMAEAHQQLQRPQQLLAIINNDFTLSQTFQDDPSKGGVLQFPHPITFGFPLPSRGAVVYGPDGKPWFSRKTIVSSVGSTATATLELYNMEDKLIAACVEQTTETGTRFQCLEPGQPGEDARSIFLLEKAPKERVYFLSMSKTGEVIQCAGILEYWHKKSYEFTLPPSEEQLAVMSKNHNVVAGTRGVQIAANQDVIALLCAAWCLEHWNTSSSA